MPRKNQFARQYHPGDLVGENNAIFIREAGKYIPPDGKSTARLIECECCNDGCTNTFIAQENRIHAGLHSGQCDDCRRRSKTIHIIGRPVNHDEEAPIFLGYVDDTHRLVRYQCRRCYNDFIRDANDCESSKRYLCVDCLHNQRISSLGEKRIQEILSRAGIVFEREKTFNTCLSDNGVCLRFDFFLPEFNVVIEFDGEQHFHPIEFFGGERGFAEIKRRDAIKNKWCYDNAIKLLRISYLILDKGFLTDDYLLSHIKQCCSERSGIIHGTN